MRSKAQTRMEGRATHAGIIGGCCRRQLCSLRVITTPKKRGEDFTITLDRATLPDSLWIVRSNLVAISD